MGALVGLGVAPHALEGATGGSDRLVHVRRVAGGNFGEHLAGGGIARFEGLARGGGDPLPVAQELLGFARETYPQPVQLVGVEGSVHRYSSRFAPGLSRVALALPLTYRAADRWATPRAERRDRMAGFQADYVIVGAGSAGAVLAARLTEDPATRVLLLEAGAGAKDGAEHWLLKMPLGFLNALFRPGFTWPYRTEPEPHLNNRQLFLPRGKLLGGSSAINGMFYMRGHSGDFDRWAQKGCQGCSYDDVLPCFLRMERHWAGAWRRPRPSCTAEGALLPARAVYR